MQRISTSFEDILDDCIIAVLERGQSVNECLERYPTQRELLEPLLLVSLRLRAQRTLQPSGEFRRTSAIRLQNMIAASPRHPAPVAVARPARARWYFPMLHLSRPAILLAVVLIWLLIGSGTVYASNSALPGEPLYSVKTTVEAVQLAVTLDDTADAELQLQFAKRRLNEADVLLRRNQPERANQALQDFRLRYGAVLELIERNVTSPAARREQLAALLVDAEQDHEQQLGQLLEAAPAAARQEIEAALATSRQVRERALDTGNLDPLLMEPLAASATPSLTPSATATALPTASHTASVTPSLTASLTPSATATALPSLTPLPPTVTPLPPTPVPVLPSPLPPTLEPVPPTAEPVLPTAEPTALPTDGGFPWPTDLSWPTEFPWPTDLPWPPQYTGEPGDRIRETLTALPTDISPEDIRATLTARATDRPRPPRP